jgi:hypothetical protein
VVVRRHWVIVVSRDHARRGVRDGFVMANHGKRAPLARMSKGDGVFVYSPATSYPKGEPLRAITFVGEITGDEPESSAVIPGGFRRAARLREIRPLPLEEVREHLPVSRIRFGFFELDPTAADRILSLVTSPPPSDDSPRPGSVTFETTVTASGNNTGIVVPDAVVEQLGAGRRPPVVVDVNGYEYRSTVAVMGGRHLIGISAAVRAATGLAGGDPIRVTLTVADAPRAVEMPADFAAALDADDAARRFFDGLSNSLQRYHVDNVAAAKSPETRRRRIDKAVALFLEGKRR